MKTDQHTVTLPIADYQELMDAKANADKRFTELRDRLVKRLETTPFPRHLSASEFMAQLVKFIKEQQ